MKTYTTRSEAKAAGATRYATEKPCSKGHVAERHVSCGHCVICAAEKLAARKKKKYEKDAAYREKTKARVADYVERNRDRHNAYQLAYVGKNRDHLRELQRKHRAEFPEIGRAHNHKRRARLLAALGSYSASDIRALHAAQNGRCNGCLFVFNLDYEIDHIEPLAKGGTNGPENLQLLCASCNRRKGTKSANAWLAGLPDVLRSRFVGKRVIGSAGR